MPDNIKAAELDSGINCPGCTFREKEMILMK